MTDETDPQAGMTDEQRRRRFVSTDDDIEVAPAPPAEPTPEFSGPVTLDGGEDGDIYGNPDAYVRARDRALEQFGT